MFAEQLNKLEEEDRAQEEARQEELRRQQEEREREGKLSSKCLTEWCSRVVTARPGGSTGNRKKDREKERKKKKERGAKV